MMAANLEASPVRRRSAMAAVAIKVGIARADTVTYNVDLDTAGGSSITGTIQTDGTFGVLSVSNITDYNLILTIAALTIPPINSNPPSGPPIILGPFASDFTPATTQTFTISGTNLTATPTNLLFTFEDTSSGKVYLSLPTPAWPPPGVTPSSTVWPPTSPVVTSYGDWISISTTQCGYPNSYCVPGGVEVGAFWAESAGYGGESTGLAVSGDVIGTTETPLPAALPFFATGLSTIGFFVWRRKRKYEGLKRRGNVMGNLARMAAAATALAITIGTAGVLGTIDTAEADTLQTFDISGTYTTAGDGTFPFIGSLTLDLTTQFVWAIQDNVYNEVEFGTGTSPFYITVAVASVYEGQEDAIILSPTGNGPYASGEFVASDVIPGILLNQCAFPNNNLALCNAVPIRFDAVLTPTPIPGTFSLLTTTLSALGLLLGWRRGRWQT